MASVGSNHPVQHQEEVQSANSLVGQNHHAPANSESSVNGAWSNVVDSANQNNAGVTHQRTGSAPPLPDNNQALPLPALPESIPPHLLTLQQAVESLYVPKERYQELERNFQELASELERAKTRIQELEQKLADYEESTSVNQS